MMSCPACALSVTSAVNGLYCKHCKSWYHFDCTKLPIHHIVLLCNSKVTFLCETCIVSRYQSKFLTDHSRIETSIKKHKLLRSGNLNNNTGTTADHSQTVEVDNSSLEEADSGSVVTDPTITENSSVTNRDTEIIDQGVDVSPTYISSPDVGPDLRPNNRTANVTHVHKPNNNKNTPDKLANVCKFHLQGCCKFGRFGHRCSHEHPGFCRSFILKGEAGCNLKKNCPALHPKLCPKSLKDNTCPRIKCNYYHVTGSTRPNLKSRQDHASSARHGQGPVSSTPNSNRQPMVNRLAPQTTAPVAHHIHATKQVNFLDELRELKVQLNSMLEQQRQMQSLISHQWQTAPGLNSHHWPSLPVRPHPLQYSTLPHQ